MKHFLSRDDEGLGRVNVCRRSLADAAFTQGGQGLTLEELAKLVKDDEVI